MDNLTLAIPEGTVFGFLGPNGAGKTTTVRMLSALIAPTRGSAAVAGYRLGELSGQFELTVLVAVIAIGILIPLAILLIWGAAQLFQREAILTRWK